MERESELNGTYGKNPSKFDELKNISKNQNNENRYLVCNSCSGYYKLKDNEHPHDFEECECGNSLEYYENIEVSESSDFLNSNKTTNSYSESDNIEYYDKQEEIQEIVDLIKNDSEERKKILEKLHDNIKKQEMVLNNIKHEKIIEIKNNNWSLWDQIESREIENNISDQKMIVDEILEQENRLLSRVRDKRNANSFDIKTLLDSTYGKIAVLIWIIIILSIILVYIV